MTYSDIYTKFLIEYDKQNITSSYPSLTVYEIATILDKAYLALIAQKLTGNNPRRAPFEIDIKAIEDLRPLIKSCVLPLQQPPITAPKNCNVCRLDDISDFLYYVASTISEQGIAAINLPIGDIVQGLVKRGNDQLDVADGYGVESDQLISFYDKAGTTQYFAKLKVVDNGQLSYPMLIQYSNTNTPLNHAFYANNGDICLTADELSQPLGQHYQIDTTKQDQVLAWNGRYYSEVEQVQPTWSDPITLINHSSFNNFIRSSVNIPWIKTAVGYLEDDLFYVLTDPFEHYDTQKQYCQVTVTYIKRPQPFVLENDSDAFHGHVVDGNNVQYEFELNDSMAEELINLAVVMALETVESPRIQMKEQTRALES